MRPVPFRTGTRHRGSRVAGKHHRLRVAVTGTRGHRAGEQHLHWQRIPLRGQRRQGPRHQKQQHRSQHPQQREPESRLRHLQERNYHPELPLRPLNSCRLRVPKPRPNRQEPRHRLRRVRRPKHRNSCPLYVRPLLQQRLFSAVRRLRQQRAERGRAAASSSVRRPWPVC